MQINNLQGRRLQWHQQGSERCNGIRDQVQLLLLFAVGRAWAVGACSCPISRGRLKQAKGFSLMAHVRTRRANRLVNEMPPNELRAEKQPQGRKRKKRSDRRQHQDDNYTTANYAAAGFDRSEIGYHLSLYTQVTKSTTCSSGCWRQSFASRVPRRRPDEIKPIVGELRERTPPSSDKPALERPATVEAFHQTTTLPNRRRLLLACSPS